MIKIFSPKIFFYSFFLVSLLMFLQIRTTAQVPKLILPIGHGGFLNSACFSPDDKKVVTASEDHLVKIWNAQTGELLTNLSGHIADVNNACFSPDGSKIVSSSNDNTARLWDAESALLLAELKNHTDLVNSALFSPDGKWIVTASEDHNAIIWDARTGSLVVTLKGHLGSVNSAVFSADNKKVVTTSDDHTAIIWNAETGQLLLTLKGHTNTVGAAVFSPDGNTIVTASDDQKAIIWNVANGQSNFVLEDHTDIIVNVSYSSNSQFIATTSDDSTARIWNTSNGKLVTVLKHKQWVNSAVFSPDSKTIVTASEDKVLSKNTSFVKIWDVTTGQIIKHFDGHNWGVRTAYFSSDGKKIVTASMDHTAVVWNIKSKTIILLSGKTHYVNSASFSSDNKRIVSSSSDGTAKIWDAQTGKLLTLLDNNHRAVNKAVFSPDNKRIAGASESGICKIWNADDGAVLTEFKGHARPVYDIHFSQDGKRIVTASADRTAKIWNVQNNSVLFDLKGHTKPIYSAVFSPDGKLVLTASADSSAKIWDAFSGKLLLNLKEHTDQIVMAAFSPDGRKIVTSSFDSTIKIWEVSTGRLLYTLKGHTDKILTAGFSPDGTKIVSGSMDFTAKIWDLETGQILHNLKGHEMWVVGAGFSPDGKKIVSASRDNTSKVWDVQTGRLLYGFFGLDLSHEYLLVDNQNHYDGTEGVRKLLYYTCGTEIITLQQLKDKLWVPNLAERINKGETINSPGISELDVCGLVPLVGVTENKISYRYTIKARRGGLGETALFVNGIEARRYKASALKKNADNYVLLIPKTELEPYLVVGSNNLVTVKAYTSDNSISSRGVEVSASADTVSASHPNLYAVMIGVSDYKGNELDLKYAAKDATDLSAAISNVSKKLLNTDKNNQVFMYNLITPGNHYLMPEKRSVQKLLEEIGKKTKANDILLIFFAGHGVMVGEGDKKQFYFLTADASQSALPERVDEVGISANELTEWIKPQNMKAQKRILIFDACNSGQAIRDFVKIGNTSQGYIAARNDDQSQQTKAIDKLNEKAGLFILSASATNQNAYEMSRYSQGLLTYTLLKAIKQQPDILNEGKYLDVSKWFNTARESVSVLSKESGARQEPQMISNTNFNIGIVDDEVMSKIVLPNEKPLFSTCNFQNADEENPVDNLGLNKLVDQQLNNISTRGSDTPIVYAGATTSPDAYTLSGRYTVSDNKITMKIFAIRNKEVKYKIDLTGQSNQLDVFSKQIATRVVEWATNIK